MKNFMVHATVKKYDEGLRARTMSNVNARIIAEDKDTAVEKAKKQFIEEATHPKISNIRVKVDLVKEV